MELYIGQQPANKSAGHWQKLIRILQPCNFIISYTNGLTLDDDATRINYVEEKYGVFYYRNTSMVNDYNPQEEDFSRFVKFKGVSNIDYVCILIEDNKAYLCIRNTTMAAHINLIGLITTINTVEYSTENLCFEPLLGNSLDNRTFLPDSSKTIIYPTKNLCKVGVSTPQRASSLETGTLFYLENNKLMVLNTGGVYMPINGKYIMNLSSNKIYHIISARHRGGDQRINIKIRKTGNNTLATNYEIDFDSVTHKANIIKCDNIDGQIPPIYYAIRSDYTYSDIYISPVEDCEVTINTGIHFTCYYKKEIETLPSNALQVGGGVIGGTNIGSRNIGTMGFKEGKPIWWNGTAWVDATGQTV